MASQRYRKEFRVVTEFSAEQKATVYSAFGEHGLLPSGWVHPERFGPPVGPLCRFEPLRQVVLELPMIDRQWQALPSQ